MHKRNTPKPILLIFIGLGILAIIGVTVLVLDGRFNHVNVTAPPIEDNTIDHPTVSPAPTSTPTDTKESASVQDTTSKDEYVVFEYDASESSADYLKDTNKVLIEGSGTVANNVTIESGSGEGTTVGSESTQEIYYEMAKDEDSIWKSETDFSKGFSAIPSYKYDIKVQMTGSNIIIMNAPNSTEVYIRQCDTSDGDATYWRNIYLREKSFGTFAATMPAGIIDYDTPYTQGSGLKDWEPYTDYSFEDLTINSSGNQILCDAAITTQFGDGYYTEIFNSDVGKYIGAMFIQHGTTVFRIEGKSEYRDSLKDICTAVADRCINVY